MHGAANDALDGNEAKNREDSQPIEVSWGNWKVAALEPQGVSAPRRIRAPSPGTFKVLRT
jgi:hypothetical protein